MHLNPMTVTTMEDWIADVTPKEGKRKTFRVAMPARLTEEQAEQTLADLLRWRKVLRADVVLRRRNRIITARRPTDPRLLERYSDL